MPQKDKLEKDLPESEVEKRQDKETPIYDESQQVYISFLQQRLEDSKNQKDQPYPEFNNKTYYEYYEENEKIANSFIEEKKNKDDVIINSGTIETKLDSVLSAINQLNLEPDVYAYDEENNVVSEAGVALEDIILDSEKMDGEGGDKEKKIIRQNELVKQGTVFVQEEWVKKYKTRKILSKKYNGEFNDVEWSEKLEICFEGPSRSILYGPNVYLGNITEYYVENQPYIFIAEYRDYEYAKSIYGKFHNWKYVKPGNYSTIINTDTSNNTGTVRTIYENKWRLEDVTDNQVEIIKYQDKPNNEFQVIINGVLMLPIGFPLEAVSPRGEYNIAKQINKIINPFFAYGKGFVSYGGVKQLSSLLDEMFRLAVLKTRKSFQPPYINISNKVISSKVLSPGRISMGIPPNSLQAIGQEGQGVTQSEFNLINKIQLQIDENTVSKSFTGQQSRSGTTATEIIEMKKQAELTLGLIVTTTSLLESKLAYLRLWNILENWFIPTGTKVGVVNGVRTIVNKFRNTTRQANIDGEGMGERSIVPVGTLQEMPTPTEIMTLEEVEQKKKGFPVRKIFLNPEGLKDAVKTWYIEINPSQTKSSSFDKLMFREYLNDIASLAQFGSAPNTDSLEEELAKNWEKSRSKIFGKGMSAEMMATGAEAPVGGTSKVRGRPNTEGVPQLPGGIM